MAEEKKWQAEPSGYPDPSAKSDEWQFGADLDHESGASFQVRAVNGLAEECLDETTQRIATLLNLAEGIPTEELGKKLVWIRREGPLGVGIIDMPKP